MKVGITLLYSVLEESNLIGILKSYVIDCQNKYSIISEAQKKAEQQIDLLYPNYKFLGVEDVFTVTGEVKEGELMGRSTLYDIDSIEEARKMVVNDTVFAIKAKNVINHYCGSLVYFYEGDEEKYAFTINAITKGEIKEVVENLKGLAASDKTINKIVKSSVESLDINKINFLGIEDINVITEDIAQGGSFLVLYNEEVQNEKELLSILPSKEELSEMIDDVYAVPSAGASL
ncbi:MAG: hypothetical protein AAF620_20430 [Bacteroidota bacterium]